MNKSNKIRQQSFRLLRPLITLGGPALYFGEIEPEHYIARNESQEWYVSLSELKQLNPDKYLDNGPASILKIDQKVIEENIKSNKHYLLKIESRDRYEDPNQEWNDWFYGLQRKADQLEKEASLAWSKVSSRKEHSYVSCRSETSILPPPSLETIERMKRESQLRREIREKENAETPFWMRPTRDD